LRWAPSLGPQAAARHPLPVSSIPQQGICHGPSRCSISSAGLGACLIPPQGRAGGSARSEQVAGHLGGSDAGRATWAEVFRGERPPSQKRSPQPVSSAGKLIPLLIEGPAVDRLERPAHHGSAASSVRPLRGAAVDQTSRRASGRRCRWRAARVWGALLIPVAGGCSA